ncbi:MAG TPA: glycosyltransferase [Bryobacteraceae bacterium]|nr:glycosyltransferase [Bryobacteraceae bacterium]
MQPQLSLCMIVKDEERNLAKCLDSVRDLAPEIIIADTGSKDRTVEIARPYGARVFPYSFDRVDFAAARNHTLAQASGRWILVLDADETLPPASMPLVQALIAANENAGYYFARHNYASDAEGFTTDYVVRLFPNRADYRYRGRVHETVDAAILAAGGRLLTSAIQIDHNFVASRETRRRKNYRYIEILKEEIEADPSDTTRLDFLAAEFHQLEMFAEAALVAEEIARLRPLDPSAHLNLGIYRLIYQSDPKRARANFEQAIRLRPGYPEALSFLQTIEELERAQPAQADNA